MNVETARILAQALLMRSQAERGMKRLMVAMQGEVEPPVAKLETLRVLAETYVHEDRVINRIVATDTDD